MKVASAFPKVVVAAIRMTLKTDTIQDTISQKRFVWVFHTGPTKFLKMK